MDTDIIVSYPFELFERVGRLFNGFLQKPVITVESPFLVIKIPEPKDHSIQIITYCILQLSKALRAIKEKYGIKEKSKYYSIIQLDVHREQGKYVFQISGIEYINPFHILKLLDLVLWCITTIELKGEKGDNISEADEAKKKTQAAAWRERRDEFIRKINIMPRTVSFDISLDMRCAICGQKAVKKNKWVFRSSQGEWPVTTPVCDKHGERLI